MTPNNLDAIWQKIKNGVFVIAEAGKNFIQTEDDRPVEEYLKNAKKLVDEAVLAGADAIKWQVHTVDDEQLKIDVTSPHFIGKGSDRMSWLTRNEKATPVDKFWLPLKKYCDKKGIIFFVTPMSRGAAMKINKIGGVNLWKIGSGDILDFVLVDYIRQQKAVIIVSSGMSTVEEIKKTINFIKEKNEQVALLHCVSQYPCPPENLSLGSIKFLKDIFNIPVGFSDHSIGIEADLLAVSLGATIIEKHFSLSRDLWGADHKVSMIPDELSKMMAGIDDLKACSANKEIMLRSEYAKKIDLTRKKDLQSDEEIFRPLFRKSLMAGQDILTGTVVTKEMLFAMRPQAYSGGLPSEEYQNVLGRRTKVDLKKFSPITWDVLS